MGYLGGADDDDKNGNHNSQISREEGELSSNQDDDNCELASDAHPLDPVTTPPTNQNIQYIQPGKPDIHPDHTLPSNQHKNQRTRVPFVISFSDDDDSEDSGRHNSAQFRDLGLDKTTTLLGTSPQNPLNFQPRLVPKLVPRKSSFTRTFLPSNTRKKGFISRNGGPFQNSKSLNTSEKVASQDHGRNTNSSLDSSKMQDLRQLIAKKENELKHKSSQQAKTSSLPQCEDDRFTGVSEGNTRLRGMSSADTMELEAKEPNKKRPKTTKTGLSNLSAGQREEPLQSAMFASENVVVENSDKQKANISAEMVPTKKAYSIEASEEHEGCCRPVNMKEGTDIVGKTRLINRFSKLGDAVTTPKQNALTGNDTSKNVLVKSLSLDNLNFWNSIRMGQADLSIQELMSLEVSNDKELEEAQAHRHQCEIYERNALNSYRKAQRALAEANAKCTRLYRKREMYSAQLRSVMMENTNLFSTFESSDYFEPQLNHVNILPDVNTNLIPAAYDVDNQHTFDSNAATPDDVDQSLQRHGVSGNDVVSDQSSEYDDSAKEVENGVCCPSEDSSRAEDENGVTYYENEHGLEYERKEQLNGESGKEINIVSDAHEHLQDPQDSLLLEASLRSQLFERLRTNAFTKKSSTSNMEPLFDGTGNDNGCDKGEIIPDKHLLSHENEEKHSDLPGYQGSIFFGLCPMLRSAFRHLKILDPASLVHLEGVCGSPEMPKSDENNHINIENQPNSYSWTSTETTLKDLNVGKTGSYSCSVTIDPLWPLCMYELRGKCNNGECAWQHARDFTCKDSLVSSAPIDEGSVETRSCGSLVLIPPTYLIDLDVLQGDMCSYRSLATESFVQCWRKCFSSTLVLSSVFPIDLSVAEPFLHGNEPRTESHARWNRQLLYLDSKNASLKQIDHPITDNDQALETALLNLQYDANKQKGRIEALKVLVQAVEADPTSAVLWIVYLQIYYSNKNSIGKDDLFQYAVEYNKSSYELWIMFINSRTQFDDRFAAYRAALQALCCCNVSGSDVNAMHVSAYILDIFLQMMNSLCISGNVSRVLEIIYGLSPSTNRSDTDTFPDIIEFLTIYDKCVFWVCCVHLAIYRQVPDAIVQRFEFQKDLSVIEWPNTKLIVKEKQKAISLMETAVNFLEKEINSKSLDNKDNLKAAHLFAVNHVKCVAVLEGLGCGTDLLEKYTKLYPSCLELALMSATESDKFGGFEKVISDWPDDVPGIHCLWNQYVECALESEKLDLAKELITRWFDFACQGQCAQGGTFDSIDVDNVLQSSSLPLGWCSFSDYGDYVFKLLNFSIYRALDGDQTEALLTLDRAIKASDADNYLHCVREHSLFLRADDLEHHKKSHLSTTTKLLNRYLVDARASQEFTPLSRHYIQMIKKPRVQQLVRKLLNPLSDFLLLNSVLEFWYGPSLLPQTFEKLPELVDFAEGVMGLLPSNYHLAISVCKLLIQRSETAKLPANVSFWASSLLVNAIFLAVPVAPESVWLESAEILYHLTHLHAVSESFHKRALLVHPFSVKIWKSYLGLVNGSSEAAAIKKAASAIGISLSD